MIDAAIDEIARIPGGGSQRHRIERADLIDRCTQSPAEQHGEAQTKATMIFCSLATIAFGLWPALRLSRPDLLSPLKDRGRRSRKNRDDTSRIDPVTVPVEARVERAFAWERRLSHGGRFASHYL